ncbi:MAG: U32 family peptidase [Puniceicoccales bacterium]|jgi:putative protease|nr:U32 family peptidase [Puniceicoccales bacterium]
MTSLCKPEILAPAGNWQCACAAVENGADAIYFAAGRFNARVRADNFTEADLPELMAFLHGRGVKGYVTFNTLVFTSEIEEAKNALRAIIAAGADAVLAQDAGVCRLVRALSPDFPIHASTQMTVTSAAGVAFARELGASRVVLARECSLADIAQISAATGAGVALETFIHGALCVAYSGQCLTSEALGGRSANRGVCAQACRLPYELVCDGKPVPLGERKYLLSPQDLAGMELLPELIAAGAVSLKIEGRLKSPEYVAAVTRAYRAATDKVWAALATDENAAGTADSANAADKTGNAAAFDAARAVALAVRREFAYDLEMSFSRGLSTGWLRGVDNSQLVHARFGKKRGVYLGEVAAVRDGCVRLAPPSGNGGDNDGSGGGGFNPPLKAGDGVVFDDGHPEEPEEGGFVHGVEPANNGGVWVRLAREALDWRRVRVGQKLWKTADPALTRQLRTTFAEGQLRFRRPVSARISGKTGVPLRVEFDDGAGHTATAESLLPLAPAIKQPLDAALLRGQLGRLGGTPFALGEMQVALDGAATLPVSELNRLRRELVAALAAARAVPQKWTLNPNVNTDKTLAAGAAAANNPSAGAVLAALVRHPSQLEAALRSGVASVYCEFEDLRALKPAVAQARAFATANGGGAEIWAVPPRVFRQGEDHLLSTVADAGADGILARNHEHLRRFAGLRLRGDFSLNIANPISAAWFKNQFSLERLTASLDLNAAQLDALLRAAPPEWFEVTLHQRMPMFHMEHCVFCAFLSRGKDFRDCGRPCETHTVRLRDRAGMEHLVRADAACRNTVFNGRAQTGAEFAAALFAAGARHFRIEFADETPVQIAETLARYGALFRGEITGTRLWRELKLSSQLGVTRGTLK